MSNFKIKNLIRNLETIKKFRFFVLIENVENEFMINFCVFYFKTVYGILIIIINILFFS
jgi:hypothetical protein